MLQLSQARLLLAASAEATLIIDAGGRVLFGNAAAERLLDRQPDELTGLDVDELVPTALRGRHRLHRQAFAENPYPRSMAASERIHALRRDGTEFPVEISLSPLELEGRTVVVAAVVDISDRFERDALVHAANELNRQIIDSVKAGIIVFDNEGRYQVWNPFMESLTGVAAEDCLGRTPPEVFPFLDEAGITDSIRQALEGQTVRNPPFRWSVPQNGRSGWAISTQTPLRDHDGRVVGVVDIVHDITEAKRAEDERQLAATVYKAIGEAIFVADADNRIIAVNPAFTSLTGYSEQEAVGQPTSLLRSDRHADGFYRDMWLSLEKTGHWQGDIWNRHRNGDVCHEWLVITSVYGDQGEVLQRIGALSDITDRKRTAQSIWQQANFDPLTGLPNRRMLRDRLEQELKNARRRKSSLALLFLDLDLFKEVNDALGHEKGDLLLQEAAHRLTGCVRESDTVARLGGDEFTLILSELDASNSVDRAAQCILGALAEPFALGEESATISASIGVAIYPDDAQSVDDLLNNADCAMYAAKRSGRNRYSHFAATVRRAEGDE